MPTSAPPTINQGTPIDANGMPVNNGQGPAASPGYIADKGAVPQSVLDASKNSFVNNTSSNFYTAPKPTSPVATTSDPATNNINNLGNNINTAQTNTPTTPTTSNPTGNPATSGPANYLQYDGTYAATPDPYGYGTPGYSTNNDPRIQNSVDTNNKLYTDRRAQLEQQRKAELASLSGSEAVSEQQQQQANQAETGTANRNLMALQAGSSSASAQAYLTSLDSAHQVTMQNMVAKYNQAVQAANTAYADKDFALAEAMVKNANDTKAAIAKANTDYLDFSLKLRTQTNDDTKTKISQQQADQQGLKDQQEFNKTNSITSRFYQYPNNSTVYDSQTGKPITANQYAQMGGIGQSGAYKDIQVIDPNAANHSPSYKEWLDYKSTGGNLGFNQYLTMDANRKATRITNNYGDEVKAAQMQATQIVGQVFSNKMGPSDKYVSPEAYKDARNQWVQTGYSATDFDSTFSGYVNPADPQDYGFKTSKTPVQ